MLGNIVTNPALLENADRIYYRECYCGLCKTLQNEHKNVSRFTLNYDMTFLIILLNEVYKEKYTKSECRCMMHPVNKHTYIKGRFVDYVSDMNILLSYYNMIDDWKDDKNTEGNPEIKGRQRQRMREASRRRMMQDVPKADVVITNPTHFAVAIKYDAETSKAPVVLAKGEDYLAQKIKEAAREHHIEIVENKPLARMLYANVDIGQEIPPELYQAVAEILAMVYNMREK